MGLTSMQSPRYVINFCNKKTVGVSVASSEAYQQWLITSQVFFTIDIRLAVSSLICYWASRECTNCLEVYAAISAAVFFFFVYQLSIAVILGLLDTVELLLVN